MQDVKILVKNEIRKAVRKEENLKRKKKQLKNQTEPNEMKEKPIPVLNLPKLELPKPGIAKGQVILLEFAFISTVLKSIMN